MGLKDAHVVFVIGDVRGYELTFIGVDFIIRLFNEFCAKEI